MSSNVFNLICLEMYLGPWLMLSTMGKIFNRQNFEIVFLFLPENRIWHFVQIVSIGDNLYGMSNPVF